MNLSLVWMVPTLLSSIALGVLGLSLWRAAQIRSKDQYVLLYTDAANRILDDEEFGKEFKELIFELTPYIQDELVATSVAAPRSTDVDSGEQDRDSQGLVERLVGLGGDRQQLFISAIFYFMTALSYSSKHHGRRYRQQLRRELADRRALLAEGVHVYVHSHPSSGVLAHT